MTNKQNSTILRVSLVNINLLHGDAIGQCLIYQLHYLQRRGHQTKIFVASIPDDLPENLKQVVEVLDLETLGSGGNAFFANSDVYIYHYPVYYPLMESMRERSRGAVVLYYHNITPPELWPKDETRTLLQYSIEQLPRFTAYADFVATDSQYNADVLMESAAADSDQIRVLPLPVAEEEFFMGQGDSRLIAKHKLNNRRVMLYVGRIAYNKRVDLLVEALARVKKEIPSALLLLVGDNKSNPSLVKQASAIRRRAKALGVGDDVCFAGRVKDVAPYFRVADVYTSASLHEGFGVPLVEAMASGVPVVASDIASHPWVLGEAGTLVEPDNPQALADAVIRIFTDDAASGEMVRRGLRRARDFSVAQYEEGLARLLAEATTWVPWQPFPEPISLTGSREPQQPGTPALVHEEVATMPSGRENTAPATVDTLQLPSLDALRALAGLANPPYQVRSNRRLVGRFIAWFRYFMTSHFRVNYVDPVIRRQEAFNHEIVSLLERAQGQFSEKQIRESKDNRKSPRKKRSKRKVAATQRGTSRDKKKSSSKKLSQSK